MNRRAMVPIVGGALFLGLAATMVFGEGSAEEISLPLACTPGVDCFVQKYVDVDPGDGIADHACGRMTSPQHKGTDLRIAPGTTADVVAVADGTVRRVRDGEPDRTFAEPLMASDARECGNGVVIEHADGMESILCHLEKGSVRVQPGERVALGEPVARVGASGLTEFRHVHLGLMREGASIDPFTGTRQGRAACGNPGEALWTAEAGAALAAAGRTQVLAVGFHGAPVTLPMIEDGAGLEPVPDDADALVAYGVAIGVEAGDELHLTASGPALDVDETATVDRPMAQTMRFAGTRLADGVPAGTYTATFTVSRDGNVLAERTATMTKD